MFFSWVSRKTEGGNAKGLQETGNFSFSVGELPACWVHEPAPKAAKLTLLHGRSAKLSEYIAQLLVRAQQKPLKCVVSERGVEVPL